MKFNSALTDITWQHQRMVVFCDEVIDAHVAVNSNSTTGLHLKCSYDENHKRIDLISPFDGVAILARVFLAGRMHSNNSHNGTLLGQSNLGVHSGEFINDHACKSIKRVKNAVGMAVRKNVRCCYSLVCVCFVRARVRACVRACVCVCTGDEFVVVCV